MSESSLRSQALNSREIKGINWVGLCALVEREVGRFLSVYLQTIVAPVITTLLFYAIFALALGGVVRQIGDVSFLSFLAPGLIIMGMVQNAFTNTSSSLVISKIQGNIVDTLMPPLSNMELFIGYSIGGVVRGFCVGVPTFVAMSFFVPIEVVSWVHILIFSLLGCLALSSLGIAAGIWADKFDHIATIQNFVVMPLTFLSGTFYSIDALPGVWHTLALYNPFFYMIDGFRGGFIGQWDGSAMVGIILLFMINIALAALILQMLRTGYKIKS